ncbi:putative protein ABIL5 [Forsythia ovata]|uniref:Protein ABIL5 n=1 Tax=Forsythia ovata TaxID=205694 RepID=A0ABD1SJB9_9LAMI
MEYSDQSCVEVEQQHEAQADNATQFNNSLQELKDLSSQLHNAADYCQSTFLNAKHKGIVVENTKEYVCKAVVIIVDHLGSISSNLEYTLSKTDTVPQTQLRIDALKQLQRIQQQRIKNLGLLVGDGLSILPKAEQTYFHFQKAPKVKRSMLNWKVLDNTTIKSRIMRRHEQLITETDITVKSIIVLQPKSTNNFMPCSLGGVN